MVDKVAHELGLDPAEVRRKNFIPPDAFPYTTPFGANYDSGEYVQALDKALEWPATQQLRRSRSEARDEGQLMGIGLAAYVEICGFGPVGERDRARRAGRQGDGPHRHLAARPGHRDDAGPDRGRRAGRGHRRHRGPSTATPP